ncbi:hypothetical protein NX774_12260 [Massilia agilis]|uniref:Uncharacterized protein n=1 Tax=Massilia agilis TaxID=1811226 RepID=A0ABT2DBV6_9BURK|nr:hypothetical protein [Massilia agilis]MCS0808694.1 hypothetical protein [Massilia agilis]
MTETIEQQGPQAFGYVVYDPETLALVESCYQVPPAAHLGRLVAVDEETRANWLRYQANAAGDGVELLPPAPPAAPAVPQQVTMRQARLALLDAGLLANVDSAIDALASPQKEEARIEWDYSSSVERNRQIVILLGAQLGLDDVALDQLFIAAAAK